ncbi:MAG: glycosyltransferase family 2 protein [Bacteroidales bacterium]|nr:glycosyltransferase family 2 protein [Bacteroidales bacterium]
MQNKTDFKKITVLIVTYKQANVIGRNLDSILQQKDYGLHEIVICDDCSPDNNWAVIQDYARRYPGLIRAYRNDSNLGIYGNSDKCAALHGDADLFCWLEGDDALCDGFFSAIQETIVNQDIDVSLPIAIQANYLAISPDGGIKRFHNDYIIKHNCNPFSAKIRGLTTWRASVFSQAVINCFSPTILDKGLALAENLFDSQWFKYAKKYYYANVDGAIYYTGIGVSVELNGNKKEMWVKDSIAKWNYLEKHSLSNKRDVYYAKSQALFAQFQLSRSLSDYIKFIVYYLLGTNGYSRSLRGVLKSAKKIRGV